MLNLFPIVFTAMVIIACSSKSNKNNEGGAYNLNEPTKVYALPEELIEISGIQHLGETLVACIQDEEGKIFIYNLSSSQIEKVIPFGKGKDYEGLAKVNNDYYILQSNGNLIQFSDTSKVIKTLFKKDDDTESLCYDKKNNRLIIGPKKGKKTFYAFNLSDMAMSKSPIFTINYKDLNPTDISIHPISEEFYVLSKEKILILSPKGSIKDTIELSSSLFQQPEGISFKENGDMLISNEGGIEKATILEFKYNQSYEK